MSVNVDECQRDSGHSEPEARQHPVTEGASSPAFTFSDLFAGIGGFHAALASLGGRCVYVSEIDPHARSTYALNWGHDVTPAPGRPLLSGDINDDAPQDGLPENSPDATRVPTHDILAGGFPCQAFSKSGAQLGVLDQTRGTLFFNILRVLQHRRPKLVFLENVRNLAGPRHRDTWNTIIASLEALGYEVSHTPMIVSPHQIPPERGGAPQVRDRVFILGIYKGDRATGASETEPTLPRGPYEGFDPQSWDLAATPLPYLGGRPVLQPDAEIENLATYRLSADETRWITVWDDLVQRMRARGEQLPGFPIWADYFVPESSLDAAWLGSLPAWKRAFVLKNSRYYEAHRGTIDAWLRAARREGLDEFPLSRRKLEWQAQDAESLWDCLMHLRPSGIRAKKATYVPALVAITQTSIYGPRRRRLTPRETARLQGFGDDFTFGEQALGHTYKQLGNAVNVGAIRYALVAFVNRYADDLAESLPELVARCAAEGAEPTVQLAAQPAARA
ncbi:DNA (cytosine-5-)-methyltransferase [Micrococcales bacterium 31B]|nr:DNA (cytosine-5-)-methyltransferase [Micrococcales bacterium 31B]